jgi:hypothetical protein
VTGERKRQGEPVPKSALRRTPLPELAPAEPAVWQATVRSMPPCVLFSADAEIVELGLSPTSRPHQQTEPLRPVDENSPWALLELVRGGRANAGT